MNGVSTVTLEGHVENLFIADSATDELRSQTEVVAVVGRGLEGDRYFYRQGSFSHWPGKGRDVTLIEFEVLAGLPANCAISAAQARRNIVTRGVHLNALVGQYFQLGEVVLYGVRLCEPCTHLEKLTNPGIMVALNGSGGLRADIIKGGTIYPGDSINNLLSVVPTVDELS